MINLFPPLRDARCTELDTLDMLAVIEEYGQDIDLRAVVRALATKIGKVADQLEDLSPVTEEMCKNYLRWQLIFQTPGVTVHERNGVVQVHLAGRGVAGSYRSLLGSGKTIQEATDKALGFG